MDEDVVKQDFAVFASREAVQAAFLVYDQRVFGRASNKVAKSNCKSLQIV